MVDAGHHRLETGLADSGQDVLVIDGDDDAADAGFGGAAGDLDDHRRTGNVGQRLAGSRVEACGPGSGQDCCLIRIHHGRPFKSGMKSVKRSQPSQSIQCSTDRQKT